MVLFGSTEYQRRWDELHFILEDLIKKPDKIDAVTDVMYKLVWDSD